MKPSTDDGTNRLSHRSHGDSSVSNGHAQEACYIESATGHHLVKVFSSANRQVRGVRRYVISWQIDPSRIARVCINGCPVTRGMRQLVFISFYPRAKSSSPSSPSSPESPFYDRCIADRLLDLQTYPRGSLMFHIVSTSWKPEWHRSRNNCHIYFYESKYVCN